MTQIEQVYNAYKENPNITDEEIANIIECPKRSIKSYRHRLVKRGLIEYKYGEPIKIIHEYSDKAVCEENSFAQDCFIEMITVYMDDFRTVASFKDRMLIGRELRLLLEKI